MKAVSLRKAGPAALLFVGGAALLLGYREGLARFILTLLEGIGSSSLAPFLFVLLYIGTCVLLLPGFVLTYGAGFLFGLEQGVLLVSLGVTLGGTASFLIGRYLARDWVLRRAHELEELRRVERATSRHGWKIVLLSRLCPFIPFRLSSYLFGVTSVPFRDYFVATFLGTFPSVVLYVYLGTLINDLVQIVRDGRPVGPEFSYYLGAISLLSLLTLVLGAALKRRADQLLDDESTEGRP